MFLTEEKALKKIAQDRARNDLKRACQRAIDAFERWPDNFDLAREAFQTCIDLADIHKAVSLLKKTLIHHPKRRTQIEELALDAFRSSFNPFLGSFLIELRTKRRDIEGIRNILRQASQSFIEDLIKRSETRLKSEMADGAAGSIENDLLLGFLYVEIKQGNKAAEPFGRAILSEPELAQSLGPILVDLEREMPDNARLKFQLARTSLLLSHPDKAEARLFQCLELPDAPLEEILKTVDEAPEQCENHPLLKGEALIRSGRAKEGVELIRSYLSAQGVGHNQSQGGGDLQHLFPPQKDYEALAESRLRLLPERVFSDPDVVFLYCDVASARGNAKGTAEKLEGLYRSDNGHAARIIQWLDRTDDAATSGGAKKLLAELLIAAGENEKAAAAARQAVERERGLLPSMLELAKDAAANDRDPFLVSLLAELYARAGDGESASEVLRSLKDKEAIDDKELLDLSGKIMKFAGVDLGGVMNSIEAGIRNGDVIESTPYVKALCVERPDTVDALADGLRSLAENNDHYWHPIADLLDYLSKEVKLSKSLNFLRARAHLDAGAVEKAIFEFDQLLMLDGDIRHDLISIYEKAAECYDTNATLHLALYQLHLEDGQLPLAAHYLCRMIEIDPEQVKDVLERFEKLVEMEPANLSIWEEMLKSALASNRISLARDVLSRAMQALPEEGTAALHVYGTKISISDGNYDDALRCLAAALTGERVDLRAIEEQLEHILMKAPNNEEARFLLGQTYLRLGREERAVAAFKDCLSTSSDCSSKIRGMIEDALPASVKPWLLSTALGEIAWSEKRFEEAYRLFATAQQGPKGSLAELGATLARLHEESTSDTRLTLILARNLSLEARFDESTSLLQELSCVDEASTERVLEILLEMLDANPEHFEANRLLAQRAARAKDPQKSLDPIVRMLSHDEMDPSKLDEIVSDYWSLFETNSLFLIPYAGLKARKHEYTEALATYRKALDIDGIHWSRVLEEAGRYSWPEEIRGQSELLKIDCMIEGGSHSEAFAAMENQRVENPKYAEELVQRLSRLIEREPRKEYYSLCGSLMARAGDIDEAELLLRRGCEALGGAERTDLQIELVEALDTAGRFDRSVPILEELISTAADRTSIYKHLERSFIRRSEREIADFSASLETGSPSKERAERIIRLCLDCGKWTAAHELLSKAELPGHLRANLLCEVYLAEGRPAAALAALGSIDARAQNGDEGARILYASGIASEQLGDFGRAHRIFSRILESGREYRDSGARAELNHTRFVESSLDEKVLTLEIVGNLEGFREGVDER